MTAPETDDITPPRDPAVFARRKRGLGAAAIAALCLVCIAVGFAGARTFKVFDSGADPAPVAPVAALPLDSPSPAAPTQDRLPVIPLAESAARPDLEARIARLESDRRRANAAAGAALAASALSEAAQSSRPFEGELLAVEQALPMSAEVRALRPLAETGVPSRAALAADFGAVAARASIEAKAPRKGAGIVDRLLYSLSAIVTVRRIGSIEGDSPDAVLARAERQVAEGDLAAALTTLRALPPRAADAIAPWRVRAQQRLSLDRSLSSIRAQAISALTSGGDQP